MAATLPSAASRAWASGIRSGSATGHSARGGLGIAGAHAVADLVQMAISSALSTFAAPRLASPTWR